MRVLIVAMSVAPTATGVAERTVRLGRALADTGVEATVLATDEGLDSRQREALVARLGGAELALLPCAQRRFYLPHPLAPELRAVPDRVRGSDLVVLLNHWTLINALAHRCARRAGVPHVVVPAGSLTPLGRSRRLKQAYDRMVGRRLVATASAWVATTTLEAGEFRPYGVAEDRVTVIPNGIDPWPESSTREGSPPPPAAGEPYLLFVGRLDSIKGTDLLVDAFTRIAPEHPRLRLVIAGPDGDVGRKLRQRVAGTPIAERIVWSGYLAGRDKEAAYRHASLLVVPSRSETMSIVALEAAAARCPVLLTDRCGFPEVEAVGGGRVVPASVEGLVGGLRELLAAPEELPRMGARLHRHVMSRFHWDRVVRQYTDLFEKVLAP